MKQYLSLLALAAGFVVTHGSAQAQAVVGRVEAGATKVAMCIGCHGIQGYRSSFPEVYQVPKISGQGATYIAAALASYKKGDRKHPSMRAIAASLSDQDMADVAAYYAASGPAAAPLGQPRQPSQAVAALLEKGACVSCHGADFSTPLDPSYPNIAGQYPDYLYASLKSYRDNVHQSWGRANPIMAGMAKQFSNAELKQLAQYIGSLDGNLHTVSQRRFR